MQSNGMPGTACKVKACEVRRASDDAPEHRALAGHKVDDSRRHSRLPEDAVEHVVGEDRRARRLPKHHVALNKQINTY